MESLGLYFYGSRWYDPALGRFAQADVLIPGINNPLAFDRYAYVFDNPIIYIDPNGYTPYCSGANIWVEDCVWTGNDPGGKYGLEFRGDFTDEEKANITQAAQDIGRAAALTTPYTYDPAEAYRELYHIDLNHPIVNDMVDSMCREGCWARTLGARHIRYYRHYQTNIGTVGTTYIETRLAVHEMGHAFENVLYEDLGFKPPRNTLASIQSQNSSFPNRVNGGEGNFGFAGPAYGWQQSVDPSPEEEFADMFIGWVYNTWAMDELGTARLQFMALCMPQWINIALTR